jgi:hypothetical protein
MVSENFQLVKPVVRRAQFDQVHVAPRFAAVIRMITDAGPVCQPQCRQLTANFANSTYHALQVEVGHRFSSGWTLQSSYIWSKTLGEEEADGMNDFFRAYRDLRNRRLDKRLLSSHRTHGLRSYGSWELPFGPGKKWVHSAHGAPARLLENWQIGVICSVSSGAPVALISGAATWSAFGADNTPVAVALLPKSTGEVRRVGDGVVYFDGLRLVPDPSIANLTTLQNLRGASTALCAR